MQVVASQHLQLDIHTNPADEALDLAAAAWPLLSSSLQRKSINRPFEDLTIQLHISPMANQSFLLTSFGILP
jgi:hypothetical protein